MRGSLLLLLILSCHSVSVSSNWWYTSQFVGSSSIIEPQVDPKILCDIYPGLSRRQRQICLRNPRAVLSVAEGVKQAVTECQFQFQFHRWNCTTFPRDFSLFGKRLVKGGTKELAFIEAVTSAAAVFNLARQCSKGFPHCSCSVESWSQFQAHRFAQNGEFKWKGCDEDLKFSTNFVRRFSDGQEYNLQDIKAITTRHNNRVGRHLLRRNAGKFCKCHGLSGSCSMKTCWRSIANLRVIGTQIRAKYDAAIEVSFDPSGKSVPVLVTQKMPQRGDLIFYEKSRDFCTLDLSRGILGTERRPCRTDTLGEESCDILCCGGQEHTMVISNLTKKCNCAFKWCCEVKCETCSETRYLYYCN